VIAVDTNVLVYAHRGEFSQHGRARGLLAELADGNALWAIPVFCLGEFLRVVTHPSILKPPTRTADAVRAIEALLHSPSLRVLVPGERYPRLLLDLVTTSRVSGNLVFDAQIAASCLEHGVRTLVSNDRDFSRFPEIQLQPLD
jgi:hypothetical protein